jgi:hypothetical protein
MKKYADAAKVLAIPVALVVGVLTTVFYFAGEQYVRTIARDEIALSSGSEAASQVQEHETRIVVVEAGVEDNEDDVEKLDTRFNDLVQKIIDKI